MIGVGTASLVAGFALTAHGAAQKQKLELSASARCRTVRLPRLLSV
jgi:hypothetical protein